MKKRSNKVKYYNDTDFGEQMECAIQDGTAIIGEGDGITEFIAKAKAKRQAENQRKMYSIRLKVSVVEDIKKKAAAAGVPYQTYINALLEKAVI